MKTARTSSILYYIKNFIYILALTILPASLLALSRAGVASYSPINFFVNAAQNIGEFTLPKFLQDTYRYFSLLSMNSGLWWLWLVALLVLIVSQCMEFAMVERHMRLGVIGFSALLHMFNDTVLSVLPYLLVVFGAYEFVALVTCGVIYVFALVGLAGLPLFVLSLVLYAISLSLIVAFYTYTLCTVPSMMADGYKFNVAASYSARLVSGRFFSVFIRLFLLITLPAVLVYAFGRLVAGSGREDLYNLVTTLLQYLFIMGFVPVFAQKTYYSLVGSVRKDIPKRYF